MKRETLEKRTKISNDIMFYIYTHIDTDINLDTLAQELKISKFYMHTIFKEIFGKNIYETIKSIRLQKASNLLLTNKYSTISEIANQCGYSSQTSFIRAFKGRFSMTPKQWRKGGYKEYSQKILTQSPHYKDITSRFENLQPSIVKMADQEAYYIRHNGYDESIVQTWQKLQTWTLTNNIEIYEYIALFHDNPTITPLNECQYVASINLETTKPIRNNKLPKFKISGGVYAKFELEGNKGELLEFIHWVYHQWLPQSDYETTTKPPFAIYKQNEYLHESNQFILSFYLPISY
jgi:AraC family transcriptional regulator